LNPDTWSNLDLDPNVSWIPIFVGSLTKCC